MRGPNLSRDMYMTKQFSSEEQERTYFRLKFLQSNTLHCKWFSRAFLWFHLKER